MPTDCKRHIYTLARRKLPRHLRNSENFYFFSFCVLSILFLFPLAPFLFSINQDQSAWSAIIAGTLISVVLTLWRMGLPIVWAQLSYQGVVLWVIIFSAYYSGGVTSPTLVWLGIVPILPLFTVSRVWCYLSLFISIVLVGFLYLGQSNGWISSTRQESPQELALAASMIGLLSVTQLLLIATYDTTRGHDIRFMQRQNQKLKQLSDDLQQTGKYKDRFLNTVSHEMRTPLNAVNGYLGLLATQVNMPTAAISFVQGAQNSAAHLLTVINDLLDE